MGSGAGLAGGAPSGAIGQPLWNAAGPPISGSLVNADLFMQPTSNTVMKQDEMINESRGEASVAFDLPA